MTARPWYPFYAEGVKTEIEFPTISLYHLLDWSAQNYSDQKAVIDGVKTVTYRELRSLCDCLAANLYAIGLRKGDRIGLMLPNSLEYVISYYAVQRIGGIVVQINPAYQRTELQYILQDSQTTGFIGGHESKARLESIILTQDMIRIFVEAPQVEQDGFRFEDLIRERGAVVPEIVIEPKQDVAVLQYTGGTTGRSKGTMLTHFNLIANVYQIFTTFAGMFIRPGERMLSISPFFHVYGMNNCMNTSIFTAATIICMKKFAVDEAVELIRTHRPTFFPGVPAMYMALLHHPEAATAGLESIKVCNCGSAPMPVEVMKEFEEKTGAIIVEGYGLSEASPVTHRNPIGGLRKPGSIGIPIPGTDSRIVDLETGTRELPPGEPGELVVKGPQVMKGYWNQPEETGHCLRDGWLFTGDIATMDEDGYFYIVGRKKEMVISNGFNIYPSEIEEVLYQHAAVREACAFGMPDESRGELLKVAIVLREGTAVTEQEILQWCTERLAKYKIPRYIEFREELPKTAVGKLLRRVLVEEEKNKQALKPIQTEE